MVPAVKGHRKGDSADVRVADASAGSVAVHVWPSEVLILQSCTSM